MRRAVAGVVLVLMLTGCGGGQEAEYGDVNELAAVYGDAVGVECSETENDIDDNGWVQTTCGGTGVIMMFTSDDKRKEIISNNTLDAGERYLQGGEWLIQDTQFNIEEAQAVLGGEVMEP